MYILFFMRYLHMKQRKNLFTASVVELLVSDYYARSGGDTFLLIHITI